MWVLQGSSDLLSVRIISEPLKALPGVRSLKYSQGEESFFKKTNHKTLAYYCYQIGKSWSLKTVTLGDGSVVRSIAQQLLLLLSH